MGNSPFTFLNYVYATTCLFATIGLSIYSLSRYIKNDDTTSIKLTRFLSTKDAIYPSISFCILPPFLEKNFDIYGNKDINKTSYIDFLLGNAWNERFLEVDYDKVTVNFAENLISAGYYLHSRKFFDWNADYYVSFRSANRKCFTINSPFPETNLLSYFQININNSIFPEGSRSNLNKIYTYIHYPGQRFTAYYTIKYDYISIQKERKEYGMIFEVRNIDTITRRNKIDEPCVEDWRNYDRHFMNNLIKSVGCHPSHWNFDYTLPICSHAHQMKNFSKQPSTHEVEFATQPCKTIDRLGYTYTEPDVDSDRNGSFWITLRFRQTKFKETIYTRAYTMDDFVGTCGGYFGLFLGYALIQFPQLIENAFETLKQKVSTCSSEKIKERESGKSEEIEELSFESN